MAEKLVFPHFQAYFRPLRIWRGNLGLIMAPDLFWGSLFYVIFPIDIVPYRMVRSDRKFEIVETSSARQ